ncbi:MAG: linear amide C-N hydrolase [Clostridia bacterium]|nr:linear amide C-N hydrolase [Clostridia bacterium]
MCTSVAMSATAFCFGRNLDLCQSFGERVVITPRRFSLRFKGGVCLENHFSFFGMASVKKGYPLYADGMNEHGLAGAGLNFPELAFYKKADETSAFCVSPFELLPWVLSQCKTVAEAKKLLEQTSLIDEPFDEETPLTPLHFHFADQSGSIVLESVKNGVILYDNPFNVLANNPDFPFQKTHFAAFAHLSSDPVSNQADTPPFSKGLGALGLPGDYSSPSRFVKAAWLNAHVEKTGSTEACAARMFEVLAAVSPPKGTVLTERGWPHYTLYSSCACAETGYYHYKTHSSPAVHTVRTQDYDLNGNQLIEIPLQ